MTESFEDVARAVYEEGLRHDAGQTERSRRRRNLSPDAAALLSLVVEAMGATRVLEIGTSSGVSTLWLARAVQARAGTVVSVDVDGDAQRVAAENVARAGLSERVRFRRADGGSVLRELPDGDQDVVLLDAERSEYVGWWPHPVRVLRPGGLLAVDNVLSHPDDVAGFSALVAADPRLFATVSPTGRGQLLAVRRR